MKDNRTEEIASWQSFLRSHSACVDGYREAYNKTPAEWYGSTDRSDWMIWVLRKIPKYSKNKEIWVRIAIGCAEAVVHFSKDPQQRPQKAIAAAKAYLKNQSEENMQEAAYAAADAAAYVAAYVAAYAAADAAAYVAAYAAADVADYADADADVAAYAAADAAAYVAAYAAADVAAYAAADADVARKTMRKQLCGVIREIVPTLEIE